MMSAIEQVQVKLGLGLIWGVVVFTIVVVVGLSKKSRTIL